MTHDEMIAVIQAHKEGKEIEFKRKSEPDWSNCARPVWEFYNFDYRIKPETREPRVIWVVEHKDGSLSFRNFLAVEDAGGRLPIRKFIEVIDEE